MNGTLSARVCKLHAKNSHVTQYECDDEVAFDIVNFVVRYEPGDTIVLDPSPRASADCTMHGTVYLRTAELAYVSCGGLLMRLPAALVTGDAVDVSFSKVQKKRVVHDNGVYRQTRSRTASAC